LFFTYGGMENCTRVSEKTPRGVGFRLRFRPRGAKFRNYSERATSFAIAVSRSRSNSQPGSALPVFFRAEPNMQTLPSDCSTLKRQNTFILTNRIRWKASQN